MESSRKDFSYLRIWSYKSGACDERLGYNKVYKLVAALAVTLACNLVPITHDQMTCLPSTKKIIIKVANIVMQHSHLHLLQCFPIIKEDYMLKLLEHENILKSRCGSVL